MTQDSAAIRLDGNVPLQEFQIAINSFTRLLTDLTADVAGHHSIQWEVSRLELGSAVFGVMGRSDDEESVGRVIAAYDHVGEAIVENRPIPYSDEVNKSARELVGLINGHIRSVIFIAGETERVVSHPLPPAQPVQSLVSIGTIRGELRTISKNRGVTFSVYDRLFHKAVRCAASLEYEELLRALWGKNVWVSGTIYRDPATGRPEEARDIFKLEEDQSEASGDYRRAVGILPFDPEEDSSEETIRQIRKDILRKD